MEKDWFKDWFASEDYLKVYNHRDSKDAQYLSDLIIKNINPQPGDIILDSACGAGRHGLYLASKGFKVIGFDLSKALLLKAKEEIEKAELSVNLLQADIREIVFKQKYFAVLNLFTSFGYFDSDEENFRFVKHSSEFLTDKGFYVLDYFNKNYLEKNLVPESNKKIEGLLINEKRFIENDRVVKRIKITDKKHTNEFMESVRLYDWKTIAEHFSHFGFNVKKIFGDYFGTQFDEQNSPRLVIIFQK
jgi:SAM-dependent methyltransferase